MKRRLGIRAVLSKRRAAAAAAVLTAIAHIVTGTRRRLEIPRAPRIFQVSIAHLPPYLVTRALQMSITCFFALEEQIETKRGMEPKPTRGLRNFVCYLTVARRRLLS